jgi:PAS domain-containing protein
LSSRLLSENVTITVYRTIILLVVLYGFETRSLALKEEHRLRIFWNRVLRRIFGSKREEVMGGWRNLHNEELHNLFFPPNIIRVVKSRRMRWTGHVEGMGKMRNA